MYLQTLLFVVCFVSLSSARERYKDLLEEDQTKKCIHTYDGAHHNKSIYIPEISQIGECGGKILSFRKINMTIPHINKYGERDIIDLMLARLGIYDNEKYYRGSEYSICENHYNAIYGEWDERMQAELDKRGKTEFDMEDFMPPKGWKREL